MFAKAVTIKTEEKTISTPKSKMRLVLHTNNKNSIKFTTTTFKHMKIIVMLL